MSNNAYCRIWMGAALAKHEAQFVRRANAICARLEAMQNLRNHELGDALLVLASYRPEGFTMRREPPATRRPQEALH